MSRVALITGAGRSNGLGKAIAMRLASEDCDILSHDRGSLSGDIAPTHGVGVADELEKTAQDIRNATGQRVETVTGDLLDESAIDAIVASAEALFGRLDILVNNAGIGYLFGPLTAVDPKHLDAVLGVNLRAPMLLTGKAVPLMINGGQGGRVINIASQAAKSGFAFASEILQKPGSILAARSEIIFWFSAEISPQASRFTVTALEAQRWFVL